MFGLALTTTAVWVFFDAAWFARRESPEYRAWAKRFSWKLYTAGIVWFAAAGSWYVFGTWSPKVFQSMFHSWWLPLTLATALAPARCGYCYGGLRRARRFAGWRPRSSA